MSIRILQGDVRDMLATLPDESVHCVVTSPPYWGLRDYGTAKWEGGNADCDHLAPGSPRRNSSGGFNGSTGRGDQPSTQAVVKQYAVKCGKCGARRIDRQIGMEPTMGEHIAVMVDVFREIRRVMRKDGTCWLNYGDCYASGGNGGHAASSVFHGHRPRPGDRTGHRKTPTDGLKPKDLCMIPNRLAIALQDDGWWVRSEIIWAKPNPMPESVTDRPATAHEKIWLLTKSVRYFYDAEAVRTGWTSGRDDMRANGLRTGAAYANQTGLQPNAKKTDKQSGHGPRHAGFNDRWKAKHGNAKKGTKAVLSLQEDSSQISLLPEERWVDGTRLPAMRDSQSDGMARDFNRQEEVIAGQPVRSGTGKDSAILCVSKGPSGDQTETCEPSSAGENDHFDADGGRMGTDQDGPRNEVCVLPEDRPTSDPGSCDSDQQGRTSHEGERGSSVSPMQRPEGEQNSGANLRNVWTIPTKGFSGAHYATFPPDLTVPCIKAGTSEKGCCAECGAPWVRDMEQIYRGGDRIDRNLTTGTTRNRLGGQKEHDAYVPAKTLGWSQSCQCTAAIIPCTVLDPFIGSGTTAMVADRLGRDCIGIDLNPENVEISKDRIQSDAGLFAEVHR